MRRRGWALTTRRVLRTPADLGSDLILWLDAGVGVTAPGGSVTGWADQSSWGNHATVPGSSPTLDAAAVGGKPALRFDRTVDKRLVLTSPLVVGNGARHYLSVYRTDPSFALGGYSLWTGSAPPGAGTYFALGTQDFSDPRLQAGGPSGGLGFADFGGPARVRGSVMLADGYHTGSESGIAWNNGSHLTVSTTLVTGSDLPVIGNRVGGTTAMQMLGWIAEIVAVNRKLTADELTQLRAYFNAKYSIW